MNVGHGRHRTGTDEMCQTYNCESNISNDWHKGTEKLAYFYIYFYTYTLFIFTQYNSLIRNYIILSVDTVPK